MADERWIVVPKWDKFQHYTDRDPLWIKVYTELNSNPEWDKLSTAACGMLVKIWLEYARSRGQLTVEKCMQLCGKSARSSHLDSLNHAGFIELSASKPLALARSREESREEKEHAGARAREKQPKKQQPVEGRMNAAAYKPFDHSPPPAIDVDEESVELARKWLRPQ